ncbi:hypothetical protein J3R30DRAFT_2196106 [Lentinula aciculospora]|uniref:DUF7330 domain-containing protein n=1 Tax=Lentinula aciculospora TaxID=153920 RepID=A0A9W9DS03_9AGAR|nr:hypothetical protein J3R30DRAFT_2196106 [Lentinula aciculospora]
MILPAKDLDEFDKTLDDDSYSESHTVCNVDLNEIEPPPVYSPPNTHSPLNTSTQKNEFVPSLPIFSLGTDKVDSVMPKAGETQAAFRRSENIRQKGVNFIYRHAYFDNITASYVIDPNVQDFSQSLLAGSPADGTSEIAPRSGFPRRRKNLCLQSECGAINVDVRVLAEARAMTVERENASNPPRKVLLDFRAKFGPIDVRLRSSTSGPSASQSPTRLPINLSASSKCGPVRISLPASFHGFIFFSVTLGHVVLSAKVLEQVSWDSQLSGSTRNTRTVFVGDSGALRGRIEDSGSSGGETGSVEANVEADVNGPWGGDKVHLGALCGSVLVDYVDEYQP